MRNAAKATLKTCHLCAVRVRVGTRGFVIALVIALVPALLPAFALALACTLPGCTAAPVSIDGDEMALVVKVENVTQDQGIVRCAIYADKETFLKPGGISQGASEPAIGGTATFEFKVPRSQEFVVSVFQDLNSNEQLDRGMLGLPREPWGFSGAPSAFGPPRWADCAIAPSSESAVVSIRLKGGGAPANPQ